MCKGGVEQWAKQNGKEMREPYALLVRHIEFKDMPEENVERMRALVDKQIMRGGYRLAYLINDIFKY